MMVRTIALLAVGAVGAGAAIPVATRVQAARQQAAQDRYCFTQWDPVEAIENGPYDGRFTFFRVSFETPFGGGGFRGRSRRGPDKKWDHDTPRAERHFMKILREITTLQPQMECGAIYPFGAPESFKYPIAYVSEPGFWTMNAQELKGVQDYVHKGGFIIFDDFVNEHWYNFEEKWHQAFPDLQIVPLDVSHPIFDSFYHIESIEMNNPTYGMRSSFFCAYEDNDPSKRLVMVADYNNDLGDYMEWSDEGFMPIALSNEAYKIMVNYVIYAMTH